jgi:hypothetical protein
VRNGAAGWLTQYAGIVSRLGPGYSPDDIPTPKVIRNHASRET